MITLKTLLVAFILLHSATSYIAINRYELFLITAEPNEVKAPPPTPPKDHAKVARRLVHKSNWAATGTISTEPQIKGFPMVNIISIADSGKNQPSTGHIYFYLTMLDYTAKDIKENNKITFMVSDDQDLSCTRSNNTDPMEPTCARVIISGRVIELPKGTNVYKKAEAAFISRHPAAIRWINAHTFFLCTIDISSILVLDWYGGPHEVSAEDYYKVPPE